MAFTDERASLARAVSEVPRGRLKVYLGATAGSGKTYAMLHEARERRSHGEDVVIGFVETHGRPRTQEAIGSLEVVPRVRLEYSGAQLEEMDLAALLARRPHTVLVDELAHTNVPGVQYEKRWQDVEALRDAGIDVVTTVNVQHLESVKDVVEAITGITIRETLPDRIVDGADEIRFIDITPEALRKRMRHGNIYPRERVEAALSNFFRPGNLAALRELGLRVVADHIETARVDAPPEDVVVAVSGDAGSAALVRRAVRIARRRRGMCTVLHIAVVPGDHDGEWESVARQLESPIQTVAGRKRSDVVDAIADVVRERGARHVVVGESRGRGLRRPRGGVVDGLVERLLDVDLHVIARYSGWRLAEAPKTPEQMLVAMRPPVSRGALRLYLGYAPGSGARDAVFAEAARRHQRGTDVVIALLASDTSSPEATDVPRLGGADGPGARGLLDVDALLARNPDVCVIDDMGASTVAGDSVTSAVPRVLAAGITVLGTVCLAEVRSVAESLRTIVGAGHAAARIDDQLLDVADEIEMVDITPEDLQERLRSGLVMPMAHVARALQTSFRLDVLRTLRELTFRRLTALSDRRLLAYMDQASIGTSWEARPRILVCVAPRPGAGSTVEGSARLALSRGDALTVLSIRGKNHDDEQKRILGEYAALTHRLGGEFVSMCASDVVKGITEYAQSHRITEVVVVRGQERRSGTLRRLIQMLWDVDVHILSSSG